MLVIVCGAPVVFLKVTLIVLRDGLVAVGVYRTEVGDAVAVTLAQPVPSTPVLAEALLLSACGSGVALVTLAVLVSMPVAVGVTVIVTDAIAPLASVPRGHVTVPPE
jgi:hypothetical protein